MTRYKRTNTCKEIRKYLQGEIPNLLFKTVIRDTTKVAESTIGVPLVTYDKKSTATQDYYDLVKEIFNI